MISIIAGKYKGRKLYNVKDLHVRPTQAKVRKSVFQILEPFDGMKVLDLYGNADLSLAKITALQKSLPKCRIDHNAEK